MKPDPFRAMAMASSISFIDDNPARWLWRSIFKDEKWFKAATDLEAEPVLIGANLGGMIKYRSPSIKLLSYAKAIFSV